MKSAPLLLIITLAVVGCASTPVKTKAEIRRFPKGATELLAGDWQELARYWDSHAKKLSVDFIPASRLVIFQDTMTAEIFVEGQFGVYGLIELRRVDERHTEMRCYVAGGIDRTIEDWTRLLRSAQRKDLQHE